jgi:hypothetical protein
MQIVESGFLPEEIIDGFDVEPGTFRDHPFRDGDPPGRARYCDEIPQPWNYVTMGGREELLRHVLQASLSLQLSK